MAKALFEVLLWVAQFIVELICLPINALLTTLFPNVEDYLTQVGNTLSNYVVPFSGYFISILPPITRGVIRVYLGFIVVLGSALITYHGIILITKIIRKIKFW